MICKQNSSWKVSAELVYLTLILCGWLRIIRWYCVQPQLYCTVGRLVVLDEVGQPCHK